MAAVEIAWSPQTHNIRPTMDDQYALNMRQDSTMRQESKTITPNAAHRHIWIIAGTSCCGKSTVAEKLAQQLGCPRFIEGDDYHTTNNKAKMKKGIPLTDADRAPWLDSLRDLAIHTLGQADATSPASRNVVVTCSALKYRYRQVFRKATSLEAGLQVHFIFLTAPADVLINRIKSRKDHFFSGEAMIKSQLDTLEMPTQDENLSDVIHVDCTADAPHVEAEIFHRVELLLLRDSIKGDRTRL